MSKSIYSLVLSDEVISQIDRLAYRKGMSRSALIDSILADEISFTTPEMRIKQILGEFQSGLPVEIFMPAGSGNTSVSVRSALEYKYNPSLRFSVDLNREYGDDGYIGALSIWLRSRSETTNVLLYEFFKLWSRMETGFNPKVSYSISREKTVRALKLPTPVMQEISCETIGKFLSRYVNSLNRAVSIFFNSGDSDTCLAQISHELQTIYRSGGTAL